MATRLALFASKGTLDQAYPPFMLGTGAAAMDWEVGIFFTFYGLNLVRKDLDLQATSIGNPAMPMKMPFGPKAFQDINWPFPNLITSNIPGFDAMTTSLMKQSFKNKGVASIPELRQAAVDLGIKMIACQMTMDVFGLTKDDIIPEAEIGGTAAFLEFASKADVSLYV